MRAVSILSHSQSGFRGRVRPPLKALLLLLLLLLESLTFRAYGVLSGFIFTIIVIKILLLSTIREYFRSDTCSPVLLIYVNPSVGGDGNVAVAPCTIRVRLWDSPIGLRPSPVALLTITTPSRLPLQHK